MSQDNLHYCWYLLCKIAEHWVGKLVASLFISFAGFFFSGSAIIAMEALLALIMIDFILGLWVAKITGQEIKSSKALRTAIKIVVYYMMISASHLTEVATGFLMIIDEATITFLVITELVSIFEHTAGLGYGAPRKLLNKLIEIRDGE